MERRADEGTAKEAYMFTLRPMLARRRSLATPGASPILMALVVLLAMMFDVPSAAAQRIRIGIGIGTGISVLQSLSKPKSDRSYSRRRHSDDVGSSRRHTSKRLTHRSRDDEGTSKHRKSKYAKHKLQTGKKTVAGKQGNEPVATSPKAASPPSGGSKTTEQQIQPEGASTETPRGNGSPPKTAALPSGTSYPPVEQAARGTPGSQPISTLAEITAAQEHFRSLGYDVPSASGQLDLQTKFAIMRFQGSMGATADGELTVEQLQRLTVMVDQAGQK